MAANDRESAFYAYSQALALDADNTEALQAVAQLGVQTGHVSDAEDAITRMLTRDPRDTGALMSRGLLELFRGRTDTSLATAERILEISPGSEVGKVLKARALLLLGKPQEALAIVQPPAGVEPSSGMVMMQLEIAREQGDAAKMASAFDQLRRLKPNDLDLDLVLDEADLRYKTADLPGARRLVATALRSSKLTPGWANRFTALLLEYDPDPFGDADLNAIGRGASKPAIEALQQFYLAIGKPARAQILQSASAGRVALPGLQARIAAMAGRDQVALQAAESILAKDSSDCDALLARAEANLHLRNVDAAVLAAQTAQGQCPNNVGGWVLLARAYDAKADAMAVRRVFEQGITANPRQSYLPSRYAAWLLAHRDGGRAEGVAKALTRVAPSLNSGWALYRQMAATLQDSAGVAQADEGAARARRFFGVDLPPGDPPAHGALFARLKNRRA